MTKHKLPAVLRNVLICPITRKPLQYDPENHRLISPSAGLSFPISHNIPLLVEELATPIHKENTDAV